MQPSEAKELFQLLTDYYQEQAEKLNERQVELYSSYLLGQDYEVARGAIFRLIEDSVWLPKIAELKQAITREQERRWLAQRQAEPPLLPDTIDETNTYPVWERAFCRELRHLGRVETWTWLPFVQLLRDAGYHASQVPELCAALRQSGVYDTTPAAVWEYVNSRALRQKGAITCLTSPPLPGSESG